MMDGCGGQRTTISSRPASQVTLPAPVDTPAHDQDGDSPLDLAIDEGHAAMVDLLSEVTAGRVGKWAALMFVLSWP